MAISTDKQTELFNASDLIESLMRETTQQHPSFVKTCDLVKLLAWTVLERRPRQENLAQRRIRSAEDASVFALTWLLERERRHKKRLTWVEK